MGTQIPHVPIEVIIEWERKKEEERRRQNEELRRLPLQIPDLEVYMPEERKQEKKQIRYRLFY